MEQLVERAVVQRGQLVPLVHAEHAGGVQAGEALVDLVPATAITPAPLPPFGPG